MILDVDKPSIEMVDALLAEWKTDSAMDCLEPSNELRKIGSLHSKYLTILSTHRRAFKRGERTYLKLRRIKYEYYQGKLDQDALTRYKWQPFPYSLKAGEITTYLETDSDILNAKKVLDIYEECMDVSERILKELGSRTYQLKDIVSWERFIAGVH